MKTLIITLVIIISGIIKAQFPFEKYPALKYKTYKNWITSDSVENGLKIVCSLSIPSFYKNHDAVTIRLAAYADGDDSSFILIYRNGKLSQKIFEPMFFLPFDVVGPVYKADINGDGRLDLKLIADYMGCGLGSLNRRKIYLFQKEDGNFKKVSFMDMIDNYIPERDFNGDKNYEIITMNLTEHKNHSYWLYNLYNYSPDGLTNVNTKYDYPVMIQYLNRKNYKITKRISREKMKEFAMPLPEEYDVR